MIILNISDTDITIGLIIAATPTAQVRQVILYPSRIPKIRSGLLIFIDHILMKIFGMIIIRILINSLPTYFFNKPGITILSTDYNIIIPPAVVITIPNPQNKIAVRSIFTFSSFIMPRYVILPII